MDLENREEAKIQKNIIEELKDKFRNKQYKYFVQTFGCAMNENDSEKLCGILEEIGYEKTTEVEEADFILYNTCTVRENADNKVYPRIGNMKRLKSKNKELITAVCGCMMQQEDVLNEMKTKYKNNVDIVFGTYNIYKLAELIKRYIEERKQIIDVWQEHKGIVEDLPKKRKHKFKALVNIVYGCNNFCTYCIVPYVRGRERSRNPECIVREVEKLVDDGIVEVVLLGQNVNSYGNDLDDKITFAKLLRMVNDIKGLERIRFVTPHPKDFTDDVIKAIKECDKVCKHVHLPIQSGSTKILNKMNRRYTKEKYLMLVDKIKKEIPTASITTDIIVGFPGEKEEDINDTIDVINKVGYSGAYTYLYSRRTGTIAANMDEQVTEEDAKNNFNKVLEAADASQKKEYLKTVGNIYKVLVEEVSRRKENIYTGRNEQNMLIHFQSDNNLIGEFVNVKIVEAKAHYLKGELISDK